MSASIEELVWDRIAFCPDCHDDLLELLQALGRADLVEMVRAKDAEIDESEEEAC
jgi:hypothetical protein